MSFSERGGWWVVAQFGIFITIIAVGRLLGPDSVGSIWRTVGNVAVITGFLLMGIAALPLGRRLSPFPQPVTDARLHTDGIFGLARHPIYGGVIIAFGGIAIRSGSWVAMVLAATLVPFFWAKSSHEEQMLAERFGDYAAYRERVRRRFIPWVV